MGTALEMNISLIDHSITGILRSVPWRTLEGLCGRPGFEELEIGIKYSTVADIVWPVDEDAFEDFETQLAELQERWPKVKMKLAVPF